MKLATDGRMPVRELEDVLCVVVAKWAVACARIVARGAGCAGTAIADGDGAQLQCSRVAWVLHYLRN